MFTRKRLLAVAGLIALGFIAYEAYQEIMFERELRGVSDAYARHGGHDHDDLIHDPVPPRHPDSMPTGGASFVPSAPTNPAPMPPTS